jgi:hypothetical protein
MQPGGQKHLLQAGQGGLVCEQAQSGWSTPRPCALRRCDMSGASLSQYCDLLFQFGSQRIHKHHTPSEPLQQGPQCAMLALPDAHDV